MRCPPSYLVRSVCCSATLGSLPTRRERVDHHIAATTLLLEETGGASTQDHEATKKARTRSLPDRRSPSGPRGWIARPATPGRRRWQQHSPPQGGTEDQTPRGRPRARWRGPVLVAERGCPARGGRPPVHGRPAEPAPDEIPDDVAISAGSRGRLVWPSSPSASRALPRRLTCAWRPSAIAHRLSALSSHRPGRKPREQDRADRGDREGQWIEPR